MPAPPVTIASPQRWDEPFGPTTDAEVARILATAPFSEIDASVFPAATPLSAIIANDCRLRQYAEGDIVVRAGDYGSSLFYVLSGRVRVLLDPLPPERLGRRATARRGVIGAVAQLWKNHRTREFRPLTATRDARHARRGTDEDVRIFLPDVPAILDRHRTATIEAGEFFGELAALARIPRTATVIADDEAELLEMRWQGFRDIRRRAPALREAVDELYRERSLRDHLRATPIFRHLDESALAAVVDAATFETVGEFDWYGSFRTLARTDVARRHEHEPAVAEEGDYPNGLILIRTGFARVSRRYGSGERTVSYLGRGGVYGLEEIAESHRRGEAVPLRHTLRGLGYVDVIRLPARVVEQFVLDSTEPPTPFPPPPPPVARDDPALLEFLVERRFINGTAAMLIDLERCTGCDDCVRACAAAHDGNPRFLRHGPQHDRYQIANACMHCVDPVCMIGCPTGAIHRDPIGGEVVINDETCIGCATCANSCPYHNIRMVDARDQAGELIFSAETGAPIRKATKCDLCVDQLGGPACQRACPHEALERVNLAAADIGAEEARP